MTGVANIVAEWRSVPGYEGRYLVSDAGEVVSLPRTFVRQNRGRQQTVRVPGRILVQSLSRKGYPFVGLAKEGVSRTFEVHRLVCRAFHGEAHDGMEAAHRNGIRTDAACNLQWKTRAENHADKRLHGTHLTGEAVPNSKISAAQAIEICQRALAGEGMRALAREFRIDEKSVRKIKRGELWADQTFAVRNHLETHHDR